MKVLTHQEAIDLVKSHAPDPNIKYFGYDGLMKDAHDRLLEVELDDGGEYLMASQTNCLWKQSHMGALTALSFFTGKCHSLTYDHFQSNWENCKDLPDIWIKKFYQYRMITNNKYVCNSVGQKELSLLKRAVSFNECQIQRSDLKNLRLDQILDLADSDLKLVMKTYTNEDVHPVRLRVLVQLIFDESQWETLRQTPELRDYVHRTWNPYELFLRDVAVKAFNLRCPPNWEYLYLKLDAIIADSTNHKKLVPAIIDLFSLKAQKKSQWIEELFFKQLRELKKYKAEVRGFP
jgi:hypothetical protein